MKNGIVSISLALVLALSIGLISCGGEQVPEYSLTVSSTEGGEVTSPGEGTFTCDEGTVVDLVAEADENYHFVNWTGNVGTIADVNDATTIITMNGNYSIMANFSQIPVTYYTLTIGINGNGSTSPAMGQHTYASGTVVPIIATPASGHRFVNWSGDVNDIANVNAASTTITMHRNYEITANFEQIPPVRYSLTITSTAGGSVTTPGEGTFPYDAGMVVSMVSTPASGYQFAGWTGDTATLSCNCQSTTITMNGNYSIAANFAPVLPVQQYTLTISDPPTGGWVTAPGAGTFTYAAGTVVNLVATPIIYHRFLNWTGDVGTIANVNAASTTITMNGNYFISVDFAFIPPTEGNLTISSTSYGSVSTPGEGTFTYSVGTVVNLVATPDDGSRFINWTGGVGTIADVNAASTTITINDYFCSITANFVRVYDLTISSTSDGSVATPGEGTFAYDAGTVVNLVATPATCCGFVNWTGDTDTIANVNAASTIIIVNDDYAITANFQPFPPEGGLVVCQPPLAPGARTFSVSGPGNPRITQIMIDPLDVNNCAWQEVTVWARDLVGNPIYQVTAEAFTNTMSIPFTLFLISGDETNGVWQGHWYNQDDYCLRYWLGICVKSASNTTKVGLTFRGGPWSWSC